MAGTEGTRRAQSDTIGPDRQIPAVGIPEVGMVAGRARDVLVPRQNGVPEQQAAEGDALRSGGVVRRRGPLERQGRETSLRPGVDAGDDCEEHGRAAEREQCRPGQAGASCELKSRHLDHATILQPKSLDAGERAFKQSTMDLRPRSPAILFSQHWCRSGVDASNLAWS
jgi:hypothetical protein